VYLRGIEVLIVDAPKRRWKRVRVDIRVRLRRWEEPEEAGAVVRTYELSEGGMSVYASETLECGAVLLVEMALPGAGKPLRIKAVVKNRRGFRCGMEFVNIAAVDRSQIVRYLAAVEGVVEILEI
jgi:c-di-GMP-binding flagellar brake protein YcgR